MATPFSNLEILALMIEFLELFAALSLNLGLPIYIFTWVLDCTLFVAVAYHEETKKRGSIK